MEAPLKRGEVYAFCPSCDQPMEKVRASRRHPYVYHCSRCDPPLPTREERLELALANRAQNTGVYPGVMAQLDDGRVGLVLATLYQPDAYWVAIDGEQQKVLREHVTGRAE